MSKQKIRGWVSSKYPYEETEMSAYDIENIIHIIDQYTKDQSAWVSVDDRLPEEDEAYQVTDGTYVNISEWDGEDELFLPCADAPFFGSVTHWQPLPLPPTQEA